MCSDGVGQGLSPGLCDSQVALHKGGARAPRGFEEEGLSFSFSGVKSTHPLPNLNS